MGWGARPVKGGAGLTLADWLAVGWGAMQAAEMNLEDAGPVSVCEVSEVLVEQGTGQV